MTGLNHVATGTAFAVIFRKPEIAIPLSFISHFVLDSIPHSIMPMDRKRIFNTYLIVEAISMVTFTVVCMVAFPQLAFLIGVCSFIAFAPDILWPFYYNGQLRDAPIIKYYYKFHVWIQWSETYRGWLTEVLYFMTIIIFISNYHVM